MKKFLILALALFTIVGTADAQRKKGSKKNKGAQTTAQAPQGPKKESFTKPSDGLFGVSRKGKDWYFIVPDSVLNQPILAVTRYIATPAPTGVAMYRVTARMGCDSIHCYSCWSRSLWW